MTRLITMCDSRKKTLIEIITGKVVSLIIGYFVNILVLPLIGVPDDAHGIFISLSALFVGIASIRSYLWRRLFNYFGDDFLK